MGLLKCKLRKLDNLNPTLLMTEEPPSIQGHKASRKQEMHFMTRGMLKDNITQP